MHGTNSPTSSSYAFNAIFVLIKPGVTIVMPMDQPTSILRVSKKLIVAALLAWYHNVYNHSLRLLFWTHKQIEK